MTVFIVPTAAISALTEIFVTPSRRLFHPDGAVDVES
jgi:hypothetical protein